jgi:fucose permease
MRHWQIKASLFLNYFVFAILLNSVGTVILQVQNNFGVTEGSASVLEAFKDLSVAAVSFLLSSFITRIGYKRSMLISLGFVSAVCFLIPLVPSFWAAKLLFAAAGSGFALIKMSVFGTIGLITKDEKEHISLMNFVEAVFMTGVLSGYFVFSAFADDANPASTCWMNVYWLLGAITLAAFFLLLTAPLDETQAKPAEKEAGLADITAMFRLLAVPLVLVFILCAFFYVLIEQSIMSWLPTFNSKVLQLPTTLSIQMASIMAGGTALGRALAGFVMKRLNWYVVLNGCLLLAAALVFTAIPLSSGVDGSTATGWGDAPLAAFVFPMIGFFLAPIYPAINSLILSGLPRQQQGLMSGLIIVFSALGGTTGSIITGHIFGRFGGEKAFYFSLFPITVVLIGLYFFRKLHRDRAS